MDSAIRTLAPFTEVPNDPPCPAADSESSILAALRSRLKATETQISELKNQLRERDNIIATLHGELSKRPPAP